MILSIDGLSPQKLMDRLQEEIEDQVNQGGLIPDLVFVGRVLNVKGIPDGQDVTPTLTDASCGSLREESGS